MRKLMAFMLAAVSVVSLVGCNAADDLIGADNPNVRFLNASAQNRELQARAGGTVIGQTVGRGQFSSEVEIGAGTYDIDVYNAAGEIIPNADLNARLLETNSNYLVVTFNSGTGDGLVSRLVRENEDTTAGMAEVTFVRATNLFGDVDAYLVPQANQDLDNAVAVANLATLNEDNEVFTVNPGNYVLRVFPEGQTTGQLYQQQVTLEGSSNYMLILGAQGEEAPFNGTLYVYRER